MSGELLSFSGSFAIFLTLGVGLMLGLIGGGGSVIIVPILVYVLGMPAATAVAVSLPVLGATSLAGTVAKARRGEVHGRALWLFGVAGVMGAMLGSQLTKLVPQPFLLLTFAGLLTVVGLKMWLEKQEDDGEANNKCHYSPCLAAGGAVGVLTGFLGVGGGFLLVPALRRFANQSMKLATGTSLGIIAINSAAGSVGHLSELGDAWGLILTLTAAALIGLIIGLKIARRIPSQMLEKAFAGVTLSVAIYLFFANGPEAFSLLSDYFLKEKL